MIKEFKLYVQNRGYSGVPIDKTLNQLYLSITVNDVHV